MAWADQLSLASGEDVPQTSWFALKLGLRSSFPEHSGLWDGP